MSDHAGINGRATTRGLPCVAYTEQLTPQETRKQINNADDLAFWQTSRAYGDLVTFLHQLNRAMFPQKLAPGADAEDVKARAWPTDSVLIRQSPQVMRIKVLVQTLDTIVGTTPPLEGPRRFGNVAFRSWFKKVEERLPELLQQSLPDEVMNHVKSEDRDALRGELGEYLLGSFGSAERLDYGTGHELSFIAFLSGLWKLHGFAPSGAGEEERGIVVGIMEPYFELVRKLISTYNLEPAGSHGVWGLDDHSFAPYIFGSAQFAPAIDADSAPPNEGSFEGAPPPDVVNKERQVRELALQNLYCGAINFILDVKKGPFWEHSPILFDISGLNKGWAKVNKGLLKMYNVEVLGKFPVVQHLRFGSLLRWEQDPDAMPAVDTVHARSQPTGMPTPVVMPPSGPSYGASTIRPQPGGGVAGTAAPWAHPTSMPSATGRQYPSRNGPGASSLPPVPRFASGANGSRRP